MKNERIFLSIGANQGDRENNLNLAIERLNILRDTQVIFTSRFIETEPWGEISQPKFLNGVVEIRTELDPHQLLLEIKNIETELGRIPTYRWGPRVIDIDIIAYGRRKINEWDLIVPHKYATKRDFVMVPLREIAPDVADELNSGTLTQ